MWVTHWHSALMLVHAIICATLSEPYAKMIRVGGIRAVMRRGGDRQVRVGLAQLSTDPINPWACCPAHTPAVINLRPTTPAVTTITVDSYVGKCHD